MFHRFLYSLHQQLENKLFVLCCPNINMLLQRYFFKKTLPLVLLSLCSRFCFFYEFLYGYTNNNVEYLRAIPNKISVWCLQLTNLWYQARLCKGGQTESELAFLNKNFTWKEQWYLSGHQMDYTSSDVNFLLSLISRLYLTALSLCCFSTYW
jgi:hypothetical protein